MRPHRQRSNENTMVSLVFFEKNCELLKLFLRDKAKNTTSLADNADIIFCTVGLTPLIVLRLTLIAGMDPPDMTVTFFGIIPPPRGVATVVPVNFA